MWDASQAGRSSYVFQHDVWPILAPMLDAKAELIPCEGIDSELAKALDLVASVDYMVVMAGAVFPLAARVQWVTNGGRPFNTFTFGRTSCHVDGIQKLLHAEQVGALVPAYVAQAYVEDDKPWRVLSAAIAKHKTLMMLRDRAGYRRTNGQDGKTFVCVPWTDFPVDDIDIYQGTA